MVLYLSASGEDDGLVAEASRENCALRAVRPGLLAGEDWPVDPPVLALARQALPHAGAVLGDSVNAWARLIFEASIATLPEDQPWQLHIAPHYGVRREQRMGARAWHSQTRGGSKPARGENASPPVGPAADAGTHRCELIRAALLGLLREKRRHLLKRLRPEPTTFSATDSLVQLLLTEPGCGWLSISTAPEPHLRRQWLSPFPKGEIPVASDKAAPSRAFAKLVEAQLRWGQRLTRDQTCVDLGASPGGWTWVARQQGARVIAVDRSPLREDLMADPAVTFVRGDAFSYRPSTTVDWLICDVIAPPDRSASLVLEWARQRWVRHFVVTIKLRGGDHAQLDRLKHELPVLTDEWFLTHLCANKHEACVFGRIKGTE